MIRRHAGILPLSLRSRRKAERKQVEISFVCIEPRCWTHEPNSDFYDLHKLITTGDWIKYSKTKTDSPEDTPLEENKN
jgi:hypothetical protein